MEELLKQLIIEVKSIGNHLESFEKRFDTIETKVDSIKDQLSEFEAKTATYHLETLSKMNDLSESIDFLKYEDLEIKQDVFTIKKKLEIIK